jgi:hypothetical protein
MFGIKTFIKNKYRQSYSKVTGGKIYSKINIEYLVNYFKADLKGHQADPKNGNLGYGWFHYSFIRILKPKNILCIGSRYGFIPAVLAQACKDNNFGHVDFVDAGFDETNRNGWTGVGFWKTKYGRETFIKFGLKKWIKLYVTTTSVYEGKNKIKRYGYIYIDGDHSYGGVKTDYKLFWPKLLDNGFMAFHDISILTPKPEGIYGVNKLWQNIIKGKAYLVFDYKESGLGIIQKT